MTKPFHIVCPNCGSPDVFRHAKTHWDFRSQSWVVKSMNDRHTCTSCHYSGQNFYRTKPLDLTAAQIQWLAGGLYIRPLNINTEELVSNQEK